VFVKYRARPCCVAIAREQAKSLCFLMGSNGAEASCAKALKTFKFRHYSPPPASRALILMLQKAFGINYTCRKSNAGIICMAFSSQKHRERGERHLAIELIPKVLVSSKKLQRKPFLAGRVQGEKVAATFSSFAHTPKVSPPIYLLFFTRRNAHFGPGK
jgi:hypothetical protein